MLHVDHNAVNSRVTDGIEVFDTSSVVDWLLMGDPAIRWQTMQAFTDASADVVEQERQLTAKSGWGAQLLQRQDEGGTWGKGLYSPKWTSSTYTLLLLKRIGLPPGNPQALRACQLLIDKGFYEDGGINFWKSYKHSETCVTGMILAVCAYFGLEDGRIHQVSDHLIRQQMSDGGWNCESFKGAIHGSVHTTMIVLEALHAYQRTYPHCYPAVTESQARGCEFLLQHRLFRSDKTGEVINSEFTRFSFPPRWHYDVLRALDYFQERDFTKDKRFNDAIALLRRRRGEDGTWKLQNNHRGKVFFRLEKPGQPSRWNTLRAMRVMKWWNR